MNCRYHLVIVAAMAIVTATGCQDAKEAEPTIPPAELGIGPITAPVTIPTNIDSALASKGKVVFEAKCTACHKIEAKYVGPALGGVTKRRRPEWIMNMILNPTEMTQKNETAKALLAEYLAQMANQNLTPDEARSVLEYFRQRDSTTP